MFPNEEHGRLELFDFFKLFLPVYKSSAALPTLSIRLLTCMQINNQVTIY